MAQPSQIHVMRQQLESLEQQMSQVLQLGRRDQELTYYQLKQQLKEEQERVIKLEKELKIERKRREKAEADLQDQRRGAESIVQEPESRSLESAIKEVRDQLRLSNIMQLRGSGTDRWDPSSMFDSAIDNNDVVVVNMLVEQCCPSHRFDLTKALVKASRCGHTELVKVLIKTGADVNGLYSSAAPLHEAAGNNKVDVCRELIESGADVHIQGSGKWTPLHFAADRGHLDVIKLLLEKGADVSQRDSWGNTALQLAHDNGYLDVVEFLHSL